MTRFWKQFAAWVIGLRRKLRDDLYLRTRLRFTLYFVGFSTVFLVAINLVVGYFSYWHADDVLAGVSIEPSIRTVLLDEVQSVIIIDSVMRVSLFLLLAIIASYFLVGRALVGVKKTMDARRRFIDDASHELRTPLSIMKTNAEVALLSGADITPEEAIETIRSTVEEIDRMSAILQNLLYLSHSDESSREMPFSKVNLCDVALRTMHVAERLAKQKNVVLTVSISESALMWGNVTALEEMVLNLIKNAITYTPEGGSVDVSIKSDYPKTVELSVRDTGIGIAAKDLPHVFDPFYKGDKARMRVLGGSSGLGLTIVREVVKHHKGTIAIDSVVGKGTKLSVRFPMAGALDNGITI